MEKRNNYPFWVDYISRTRQSYLNPIVLNSRYERELKDIHRFLVSEPTSIMGIFPVAHEDQTAFVINKNDGSAVFFDVGQSAILKSAFSNMREPDPQSATFEVFRAAACLKISIKDGFMTDKLGDCVTQNYTETVVNPQALREANGTLARFLKKEKQQLFNKIVDSTIIAHEYYHYLVSKSIPATGIEALADSLFSRIVDIATNDISLMPTDHLSEEKKRRYKIERDAKRDFYYERKKMVCEEIVCDLYAMMESMMYVSGNGIKKINQRSASEFMALHSIAFNLHLLHLAFTERAAFYVDHDRGDQLPGSMSLYNLRRIAAAVLGSEWYAISVVGAVDTPEKLAQKNKISQELQVLQNHIYVEMSHYFLVPLTVRINACFDLIERTFPRRTRPAPTPLKDVVPRLYYSLIPIRLSQSVLNEMFNRAWSSFRKIP